MTLPKIFIEVAADVDKAEAEIKRLKEELARIRGNGGKPLKNPFDPLAKGAKSATGHTANLTAQLNDIGVMLAAGQSPLQLAMQQGTQVNQVFAQLGGGRQALTALAGAFTSMINPLSLATIGIIAGGAALLQWAQAAFGASEEAAKLAEKMAEVQERSAALNEELRGLRLGVSADELTLMDAIAAAQERVLEAERLLATARGNAKKGAMDRLELAQSELAELERQLSTLQLQNAEKETLTQRTREMANAEYMLGQQMQSTGRQLRENEAIAQMLRDGIKATVIEGMQLAGLDLSTPLTNAQMEAAKLASELGMTYQEGVRAAATLERIGMFNAGNTIGQINAISQSLGVATAEAIKLARALPGYTSGGVSGPDGAVSQMQGRRTTDLSATTKIYDFQPPKVGGGGGGGGGGAAVENTELLALIENLKTEREILEEWYAESQDLLAEANAAELEALGGHNEARLRLEKEYQDRLAQIKEAGNANSLQSVLSGSAEILGAMGAFNDKALKVSRAFAAAEALISTYRGAAKELEKGTFGFATAAAVIAKGLAFVGAIRNINASSSGGFGGTAGTAAAAANVNSEPQVSRTANVTIVGEVFGRDQMVALADQLAELQRDGMTSFTVSA